MARMMGCESAILHECSGQGAAVQRDGGVLRYGAVEQPLTLAWCDPVEGSHRAGEDGLHLRRQRAEEVEDFGFECVRGRPARGEAPRVLKERARHRTGDRRVGEKRVQFGTQALFRLRSDRERHALAWSNRFGAGLRRRWRRRLEAGRRARAVVDVDRSLSLDPDVDVFRTPRAPASTRSIPHVERQQREEDERRGRVARRPPPRPHDHADAHGHERDGDHDPAVEDARRHRRILARWTDRVDCQALGEGR